MNMALDEAISEGIQEGSSSPTIRFYTWDPPAISIGYFQGLHQELDLVECNKQGVDHVRRMTGGGAVFHDKEITYSILGPLDLFPKDIIESYRQICSYLVDALDRIGIKADFSPINDILAEGKKISGSAQTRRNGVLLQHGTLILDVDVERMFSLLRVDEAKVSDKLIKSVKKRVTSVSSLSNASFGQVEKALWDSFARGKEAVEGDYTEKEMERAGSLAQYKYSSDGWNCMR